jgi:hypothetical protein
MSKNEMLNPDPTRLSKAEKEYETALRPRQFH